MRITFLNPADASDAFFDTMVSFMRRAAETLGIELEVIDCHRDAAVMRQQARALVDRASPPEYLLLVNEEGLAVDVLPLASARGIKVLILNEGLMVPDRQVLGQPGERHANWLGELVPDDRGAGYLLAGALIEAARKGGRRRADGKIGIAALGGSFTSSSLLRINGLRQAVAEHADVVLIEVVPANWEEERARVETGRVLSHNPELAAIWSASDLMALGAADAVRSAGLAPGRDVVLGGIDWAPFAFEKIRQGVFLGSVGGHFMDGAFALVLLYDLHHRPGLGVAQEKSKLSLVTRANVDAYQRLYARRDEIDFARFSKVRTPGLERYNFSVDAAL